MSRKSYRRASAMTMLGLVGVILVMFTALIAQTPRADAHTGDQSYLYLNVGEGLSVEVHLPFVDLREHLGFEFDGDDALIEQEIVDGADQIAGYAIDHVAFTHAGDPWVLVGAEVGRLEEGGGQYVVASFDLAGVPEEVPQVFEVTFDAFFDEDPSRDALFIVANDFSRGIVGNDSEQFVRFLPGSPTQTIDLGAQSTWKNLSASIGLGLDHIKTGPDHILFVAVLLLPSVLVFVAGWKPADKFGPSLWRVLKIVSMFTVAHSITFTAAGLGLINIDDYTIVEIIIALSITAAALHNLRPIFPEREWMIAFGFGLFHGLGFASLVSDLQVSRSTQLVSLLGRNIGIEIGQAIVVLVVFPSLFLLRRTRWFRPFFVGASYVLAILSFGWFLERAFDVDDVVSRYVNEILEFPRAWLIVAGLFVGSAMLYSIERGRNRLIETKPAVAHQPDEEVREPAAV